MKIFLVTDINANQAYNYPLFKNLSQNDPSNFLQIVKSAAEAEVILFSTLALSDDEILQISNHPLVKLYLNKCYIICDRDLPYPVLPGLYTALPKPRFVATKFWSKYFKTIFYLTAHNPYILQLRDAPLQPQYLFSFTGSATSRVRKKLFKITFTRPDVLIHKTNSATFWQNFFIISGVKETTDNQAYLINYANEVLQSKFVLCPKGNGISSYRFFEVMEAGRVPVLLSDNYVLPEIPYNWDDIVIRVKENEVANIESILSRYEHRFEAMAQLNRQVYDECFLNKSSFIYQNLKSLSQQSPINNWAAYTMFRMYWLGIFKAIYSIKKSYRILPKMLAFLKKPLR